MKHRFQYFRNWKVLCYSKISLLKITFIMHLTVQGKLGLILVIKNRNMSYKGGGGRKRSKKVSRIIWMTPNKSNSMFQIYRATSAQRWPTSATRVPVWTNANMCVVVIVTLFRALVKFSCSPWEIVLDFCFVYISLFKTT